MAEIDAPSPGSWWIGDFDVANHEAGHAVVAVLHGLEVAEVRIDRPDDNLLGFSRRHSSGDPTMEELEAILFPVLAGPTVEGKPLGFPPEGESSDAIKARSLGVIVAADWFLLDLKLEELLKRPATRRAIRAVGLALRERGAIAGAEVERLVEEAERG